MSTRNILNAFVNVLKNKRKMDQWVCRRKLMRLKLLYCGDELVAQYAAITFIIKHVACMRDMYDTLVWCMYEGYSPPSPPPLRPLGGIVASDMDSFSRKTRTN